MSEFKELTIRLDEKNMLKVQNIANVLEKTAEEMSQEALLKYVRIIENSLHRRIRDITNDFEEDT